MNRNYYDVLGVSVDATAEQIKEARNFLATGLHPDRFEPGTKNWHRATEKLKEINAAYEVLGDPENRRAYDEILHQQRSDTPPPPPSEEQPHEQRSFGRRLPIFLVLALVIGGLATMIFWKKRIAAPVQAAVLAGHQDKVWSLAASPDGRLLASTAADRSIRIWDIARGETLRKLGGAGDFSQNPWAVDFSADGSLLAVAMQNAVVRIVDATTGTDRTLLHGHGAAIYGVNFSPDGQLVASCGYDKTARVWEWQSGRSLMAQKHGDQVYKVRFSPDGTLLVTGGIDAEVRLFKVHSLPEHHAMRGHSAAITDVAFSPDGRWLASCGKDRQIRVWNANTRQSEGITTNRTATYQRVIFLPDNTRLMAATSGGALELWDRRGMRHLTNWLAHDADIHGLTYIPVRNQIASSGGNTIKIWNVAALPTE